jgi:hypothetical protein
MLSFWLLQGLDGKGVCPCFLVSLQKSVVPQVLQGLKPLTPHTVFTAIIPAYLVYLILISFNMYKSVFAAAALLSVVSAQSTVSIFLPGFDDKQAIDASVVGSVYLVFPSKVLENLTIRTECRLDNIRASMSLRRRQR